VHDNVPLRGPRMLDAVRPPALAIACQDHHLGSPPCSPVATTSLGFVPNADTSTMPLMSCEVSARQGLGRSRMSTFTKLLGEPVAAAPILGSPVNVSVPSFATQVDVETVEVGPTSPLHIALPRSCCPPVYVAPGARQCNSAFCAAVPCVPVTALVGVGPALRPTMASFPESRSNSFSPESATACSASQQPLPASPQSILASMMHPDACDLRSWLNDGGLPCSPSSSDAARQLLNFAPDMYLD